MEAFGEDVSNLMVGRNMKDARLTSSDLLPNKMDVHLNVFGGLMLDRIAWKVNSTDIVAVHQSSLRKWEMKLQEKIT